MLTALRISMLALTVALTAGFMAIVGPYLEIVPAWFSRNYGAAGSAVFLVGGFAILGVLAWSALQRDARLHYQRTGQIYVPPKAPKAEPAVVLGRWIFGGLMLFGLLASALNGFQ